MANIVQLKRSSVANKIPEVANVAVGEPVVNLVDKVLYTKNGSNAIIVIGAGTTSNIAEGVNLYFTNTRAVSAFIAGDNIVIESNGRISANTIGGGGGASVTIANTSPTSPSVGDLYFDEDLLTLFIYYDDGDSDQWVEASPSSSNNPFEFSKSIAATPTEIFSFDASLYRAAKFLISVSGVSEYKLEEVFLIHDDTNVAINEPPYTAYNATIGTININYSANIVGGNVFLYGVAVSGAPAVKGEVNLIRA